MQQWAGEIRVLVVCLIKTEHERLNHQMGKSVGSCGKHIGDAGVHILIVTGVGGQPLFKDFWANYVE